MSENKVEIKVKVLRDTARIPSFGTDGAAGFDFYAAEDVLVLPQGRVVVPTGLAFAIPKGYEIQVRPRSGTSLKTSLIIPNSPGTIDADFRGEVGIILYNSGNLPYTVKQGERIAQGVLGRVPESYFTVVSDLDSTDRGSGGFGSTGQ